MKKKKNEEGGSKWQDTYGDMVTLLLCFFVMLYAMSNVDETKWRQVVISLNPKAVEQINHYEGAGDKAGDIPVDVEAPPSDEFDELYLTLVQVIEELNLQNSVEVKRGSDYTYMNFRDRVFFDGDSSVLKQEAKVVLDKVSEAFAQSQEYVGEIYVIGHTSQATPERLNNPRTDRTLSALRAMEVTVYIQEKNILPPEKMVNVSFGQFRPISPVDSRDGRAKNRRVEFVLTKEGTALIPLEDIYRELYSDGAENPEDGVIEPIDAPGAKETKMENLPVQPVAGDIIPDEALTGSAGEAAAQETGAEAESQIGEEASGEAAEDASSEETEPASEPESSAG